MKGLEKGLDTSSIICFQTKNYVQYNFVTGLVLHIQSKPRRMSAVLSQPVLIGEVIAMTKSMIVN